MHEVSIFRLYLLRAMYLLIAVGLGLTIWPAILSPSSMTTDPGTVVASLLGALAVLCVLGLRFPLQMLPLLLFELLWKLIWVLAFAVRPWLADSLDPYGQSTLFACAMGLVLVPLVIPWGHVYRRYVVARGEAWRAGSRA